MRIEDFISKFDHSSSIVLEGKRKVKPEDKSKLVGLGRLLASTTENIIFRSRNASGSDQLFSKGVANIDSSLFQSILPYIGIERYGCVGNSRINLQRITLAKW